MKNKYIKLLLALIFDAVISDVALITSVYFSSKDTVNFTDKSLLHSFIIFPVLVLAFFYIFKIYNILWQYCRLSELTRIVAGMAFATGGLFIIQMAVFAKSLSFNSLFLMFLVGTFLISGERLIIKKYYVVSDNSKKCDKQCTLSGNVMLIGAGAAGSKIINEVNESRYINNCKIMCVIDDDIGKKDKYILGVKVVGGRDHIIESVKKYNIGTIVFAIPSCGSEQKSQILNICQKTDCELRTVPAIYQLLNGNFGMTSIRNVEIEDLLGRSPIKIDINSIMNYVENKVVMVTGGGGSIGSELCRQIAIHHPKQLVIFDVYENNAYDIQNELKKKYPNLNLVALIGSVRDSKRLNSVFAKYRPQIVYHAAAHKHVPLMEDSPNESIKNNVFGTYKTAECADKYAVQKFVLISTDKAVNPTNIMGASKRICEMIVQTFNNRSDTEFVAVRFGNVLGSNGSVIPLFKKQIASGGPVTVTHPDIIRYFMTIPEAVSLVLQAGASAKGGEIFVLDMGKPVKILTLAENLIKLSGYTPYVNMPIEFTGLRPGEKLYEELLMSEEGLQSTDNELIHIGHPIEFDEDDFIQKLKLLKSVMYNDDADIRSIVKSIVTTYNYENSYAGSIR